MRGFQYYVRQVFSSMYEMFSEVCERFKFQ